MACAPSDLRLLGYPPPTPFAFPLVRGLRYSLGVSASVSPPVSHCVRLSVHHGSAWASCERVCCSLRAWRLVLQMKCAGRSVPWLCPPVAMGSTWSAVKLSLCGYFSVLSIGLLQSQHVRLGCASSLLRLRLYSGSLVRDLLCIAIVGCWFIFLWVFVGAVGCLVGFGRWCLRGCLGQ